MLAILEYGAGNQTSVLRALNSMGIDAIITANASEIGESSGIIFPGVGAAPQAMNQLRKSGMDRELVKAARNGKPILGICLGCQIFLESSEEGNTKTLALLKGKCRLFDKSRMEENGENIKIPHMGWNGLKIVKESPLLSGLPEDAEFYFVHSYYPVPAGDLVIAESSYGGPFCSVYGYDGLWAVQFHPEKSGEPGLRILKNFNDYCGENRSAL